MDGRHDGCIGACLEERLDQRRLGGRVQRRGRLVQQQQTAGFGCHQGACNGHPLTLAARQVASASRHLGIQPARHLRHEGTGLGRLQGAGIVTVPGPLSRFGITARGIGHGQVLAQRAAKQLGILRQQRGHRAQRRCHGGCRQRTLAIRLQLPRRRRIQAGQQAQQRGLARTAGTHQRIALAALQLQIDAGERPAHCLGVGRIGRLALEHHGRQLQLLPVFRDRCGLRSTDGNGLLGRQRQRTDLVAAGVVDLLPGERLEVRRHTGDHAAGLQRIFVHHEQVADAHAFGRTVCRRGHTACSTGGCISGSLHLRPGRHHALHRQPDVERQQDDPQHAVEQINRGPLALVVDDGTTNRRKDGIQPCLHQLQHAALQPQRQHRQHVHQTIGQAGPVLAVGGVLFTRQTHHHLVEGHDDGRQHQIAHHGHHAHPGRDQPQRHHRPHQPHHALQIDELALRKVVERACGLLHPVCRLDAMLRLVPRQRCGIQPLHQVGGHALAHHQRHVALQNAARAVHQPAGQCGQKHQRHHLRCLRKSGQPLRLQRVERGTRQRRHRQLETLRTDQQQHRPHQRAAPSVRKAPEFPVQKADAQLGVAPVGARLVGGVLSRSALTAGGGSILHENE